MTRNCTSGCLASWDDSWAASAGNDASTVGDSSGEEELTGLAPSGSSTWETYSVFPFA